MAETDQFRPKNCKKGNILAPHTLDQRITRFRWENCVPAMIQRFGSDALSRFIWGRLSPAGRAANSTRELEKLSKEDRRDARRPNARKHSAKAGGWVLDKDDQDKTEPEVPASANAGVEPATKPKSSRSYRNKEHARLVGLILVLDKTVSVGRHGSSAQKVRIYISLVL